MKNMDKRTGVSRLKTDGLPPKVKIETVPDRSGSANNSNPEPSASDSQPSRSRATVSSRNALLSTGTKVKRPLNAETYSASVGLPLKYLDMMKDIRTEASKSENRPLKRRRKRGERTETPTTDSEVRITSRSLAASEQSVDEEPNMLVVESEGNSESLEPETLDSESSDSSDSSDDVEWEDVDIHQPNLEQYEKNVEELGQVQETHEVQISIKPTVQPSPPKGPSRNAPLKKEEKLQRAIVHKIHLMCLFYHASLRDRWCSDYEIRRAYRRLLPSLYRQELLPSTTLSPSLNTRKLLSGLRHAISFWQAKFRVNGPGLSNLSWADVFNESRPIERRIDRNRFRHSLLSFRGSKDLSAQGFCALLRSIDIDARLICSLQPLDFTSNEPLIEKDSDGRNGNTTLSAHKISSNFPVYWVEVWDGPSNRWITVDPVVTKSIEIVQRRSRLEPPKSDSNNILRYVVGFDEHHECRDITRRYARFYNAKTRKKRISNTPDGLKWWNRVLAMFSADHLSERDLQEDAYLNSREASEDLPSNLQDFKNHPIHLKQNEILDSPVASGRIATKGKKNASETVYRRQDVKIVRSSRAWYKLGRVIKPGEQPRKRVLKKKAAEISQAVDSESDSDDNGTALYAEYQTELYIPPPVVNGIVPKNSYKNIDIYVPSMIPNGADYLPYDNISTAAVIVGIDYADVVVGFDYNKRQASPRKKGIIVAQEYSEAVMAVYEQLLDEQMEEERDRRELLALLRWKKYLTALRIRDRLNRQHGEVNEEDMKIEEERNDIIDKGHDPYENIQGGGGGFIGEGGGGFSIDHSHGGSVGGGGFSVDPNNPYDPNDGGFVADGGFTSLQTNGDDLGAVDESRNNPSLNEASEMSEYSMESTQENHEYSTLRESYAEVSEPDLDPEPSVNDFPTIDMRFANESESEDEPLVEAYQEFLNNDRSYHEADNVIRRPEGEGFDVIRDLLESHEARQSHGVEVHEDDHVHSASISVSNNRDSPGIDQTVLSTGSPEESDLKGLSIRRSSSGVEHDITTESVKHDRDNMSQASSPHDDYLSDPVEDNSFFPDSVSESELMDEIDDEDI